MAAINERAEERIASLHAIIKQLERARFGRSSEKLDGDQQAFAFDEVQTGLGAIEAELEAARSTGERRGASRPRKAFPAHLERVEIVIEPQTVACACGACQPVRIGEDISERLDVTPATFRVIVTRRPKYGCAVQGGRQPWATIATLLQTAKMNGVDPFAWLAQTLQRIAAGWPNRELDQLLPFDHHAG